MWPFSNDVSIKGDQGHVPPGEVQNFILKVSSPGFSNRSDSDFPYLRMVPTNTEALLYSL